MMPRTDQLNYMLLEAAKRVVEACERGEIYTKKPKHRLPLTILANRVTEAMTLPVKEDRIK